MCELRNVVFLKTSLNNLSVQNKNDSLKLTHFLHFGRNGERMVVHSFKMLSHLYTVVKSLKSVG